MARLLIVENEMALREFIARGLRLRGHEVTVADDGASGLELLKSQAFDLLLTDIDMPIMDGIALVQAGGPLCPDMKIIVMSGHEHQLERAREMTSLVTRVVPKPFSIAEIGTIVDAVLAPPGLRKRRAPARRRSAAKAKTKPKG